MNKQTKRNSQKQDIWPTIDHGHLFGNLHAKVFDVLVLLVVQDLEAILDLVGADMRRLTCKFDHISSLLLVQLLDVALTLV